MPPSIRSQEGKEREAKEGEAKEVIAKKAISFFMHLTIDALAFDESFSKFMFLLRSHFMKLFVQFISGGQDY